MKTYFIVPIIIINSLKKIENPQLGNLKVTYSPPRTMTERVCDAPLRPIYKKNQ